MSKGWKRAEHQSDQPFRAQTCGNPAPARRFNDKQQMSEVEILCSGPAQPAPQRFNSRLHGQSLCSEQIKAAKQLNQIVFGPDLVPHLLQMSSIRRQIRKSAAGLANPGAEAS